MNLLIVSYVTSFTIYILNWRFLFLSKLHFVFRSSIIRLLKLFRANRTNVAFNIISLIKLTLQLLVHLPSWRLKSFKWHLFVYLFNLFTLLLILIGHREQALPCLIHPVRLLKIGLRRILHNYYVLIVEILGNFFSAFGLEMRDNLSVANEFLVLLWILLVLKGNLVSLLGSFWSFHIVCLIWCAKIIWFWIWFYIFL